jgi:hypothetical protein
MHDKIAIVHVVFEMQNLLVGYTSQTCPFHVYVFLQHFNNVFKVKS